MRGISATIELPRAATSYRIYTLAESPGLRLGEGGREVQGNRVTVNVPRHTAMLVCVD